MSGARHSRSSLMSYDDDDEPGGSSYDYPSRKDVYGQHARPHYQQSQATTTRQASLKAPPQSASRTSLIDDDSEENDDQDDPYKNTRRLGEGAGFAGRATIRGNLADFASHTKSGSASWDTPVLPSATTPSLTASTNNGRRTMPGINYGILPDDYGMVLPPNDDMGQHKERSAFLPEQPRTALMDDEMDRKVSPTRSFYPPKDPPPARRLSTPMDFSDTLARLTAQIDYQPDEETLMTQHAQETLMEIQKTRIGDMIANPLNGDIPHLARSNLPNLSEPRKQVSTIFFRRIQKPLEPNTKSTQLRRPPVREPTADVTIGLPHSSITTLDQRIACLSCGECLVAAKTVITVICPKCRDAHPNHRAMVQERAAGGAR
eukprot:scaffold10861_cov180-Amphora_coffeaeformis.AAC.23